MDLIRSLTPSVPVHTDVQRKTIIKNISLCIVDKIRIIDMNSPTTLYSSIIRLERKCIVWDIYINTDVTTINSVRVII